MNSDIFNFKRFARYFKSDVTEACSNYGLSLLVMSSMPITIAVITGVLNVLTSGQWESSGLTSRILLFLLFFIITCITAPSKLYGSLTDKKEGTAFILIPAFVEPTFTEEHTNSVLANASGIARISFASASVIPF